MIIPWQDISPETLENLIREFVLREGNRLRLSRSFTAE